MQTKTVERAWQVLEMPLDEIEQAFPKTHSVIARLLWRRGIRTEADAQVFLEPSYERDLHDPFLFSGMRAAMDRIFCAIENGEHITIHGDYDADGVTGAAVLMNTLKDIATAISKETHFDFYVPHREKEGYGLHEATVDILKERGTALIITVDCGIANVEAIARAKELGMDTIVVDHHEFSETLPDAILIHPRLPGEQYPFPYLAAVGVAWKVACALYQTARERGLTVSNHAEKWLLDLVAIATVTDVMPLVGENRVLEYYGLMVLQKTKRIGLQKLFEISGIKKDSITTTTVGFQIGPRINAAGRMEHADAAFHLLMSEDVNKAEVLAQKLHGQNIERQQETKRMVDEARMQVRERANDRLLWAIGDGWSAGLVGLVAGRLAQEFARPVLVMGRVGERIVGSGRSIEGFHITEALREAGECLERFGGHPQACGFTILGDDNLCAFIERVVASGNQQLADQELVPRLLIDVEVALQDLDWDMVNKIVQLAPHGEQNATPRFLSKSLTVLQSDVIGQDARHLRLRLEEPGGKSQKFIAFGFGDRATQLTPGTMVDVVYEIGVNEWNGNSEIQCKVLDLHITSEYYE